jgi:hypothetical protein
MWKKASGDLDPSMGAFGIVSTTLSTFQGSDTLTIGV